MADNPVPETPTPSPLAPPLQPPHTLPSKPPAPSSVSLENLKRAGHRDFMSLLDSWNIKHSALWLVDAAREMKKGFILFGILLASICLYEWHLVYYYNCAAYAVEKGKISDQNAANIKLLNNQIATEQGARTEAEIQSQHFEEMYHDDENTMVPLRQAAQSKFASAPPDKRVDLLLQEMDALKSDIESKAGAAPNYQVSQPITSATANLAINVPSGTGYGAMILGSVTQAGFGKGTDALLLASSNVCQSQGEADGTVTVSSTLQLASKSLYMGQPVSNLKAADYIQIDCTAIPANSAILGGTLNWTINGSIPLSFSIPAQTEVGTHILIRTLADGLKPLLSVPNK